MYATTAPARALLQQVTGDAPLTEPITLTAKKHITAIFIAIDLTFNGIINRSLM